MRFEEYKDELPFDFLERAVLPTDPDRECWGWSGSRHPNGYALYRRWRGSRFILMTLVGGPPEGKPWALHSCDNPECVNPNHLRWGSPQENTDDMFRRGRSANGSRSTDTHCKNGHGWLEAGFFFDKKGTKICKKCRQKSFKSWQERMRDPNYVPPRKKGFEHGTQDGYRWGCRCSGCKEAKAEYSRDLRIRKQGVIENHGTSTAYTRGCRCDVCKDAKSRSDKASYLRRKERKASEEKIRLSGSGDS